MSTVRICYRCGRGLSPDAVFCPGCGTAVVNAPAAPAPNPMGMMNGPQNMVGKNYPYSVVPEKKPNKGRKILFAVLPVALILIIGIVIFAVLRKGNNAGASGLSDTTIQGNYTNWGGACCDSKNVYFTDLYSGIYCSDLKSFSDDSPRELVAKGVYSDLGVIGDYIFAIRMDGETSYVVKIDKHSYDLEIVSAKYDAGLIGQDIVDGKFYFVVDNDRLCYINDANEECFTPYRNVLKVSKHGVFSTVNNNLGLEYTSFGDTSNATTYEFFNGRSCGVSFSDGETAIVVDYTDTIYNIYELNLKTKAITPVFEDITNDNQSVASEAVNVSGDKYILTIIYYDSDSGKNVCEIYSSSKSSNGSKLIFSHELSNYVVCAASSVLKGDILLTNFPVSGTDEYFVNVIN